MNFRSLVAFLDRFHWLWLVLTAPFLLFPTPRRTPALLVVPGLWLLHWFAVRHPSPNTPQNQSASPRRPSILPFTPLNGSLLLLNLMVLVSLYATYDMAFSLPKISGMVLGMGVFFAVVREGSHPRRWWWTFALFLAMGLGVAVLGSLGTRWIGLTKIPLLGSLTARLPPRITGLPGAMEGFHPNEVAGALLWVLPALLTLSISFCLPKFPSQRMSWRGAERRRMSLRGVERRSNPSWVKKRLPRQAPHPARDMARNDTHQGKPWQIRSLRLLLWMATLFTLAVFGLTQSRSGYIGLVLAGCALLVITLPPRGRWLLGGALVSLTVVLGLLLFSERVTNLGDWFFSGSLGTDPALSLNSLQGRLELWSRAIYGIQDFPFTGMGMNTFRKVVHVLYPLFLTNPDVDIAHAHNEFLQAALDLGIPGLIAFIALYLGAFWMLWETWQRLQPASCNLYRAGTLGLFGGLLAHLIYGLTDAVALGAKPGILLWMLLGLIAGLHAQVRPL